MVEKLVNRFEQHSVASWEVAATPNLAETALRLGEAAIRFARVERKPRYPDGERESDAEHSLMLALVAPELAATLELDVDLPLVTQYAIVHDLIELKTGDVATFSLSPAELAAKEAAEHRALEKLVTELPPHTATLLVAYEQQADREARFVRAVDKLLPLVVDIIGDGERVMREDYGVTTPAALRHSHEVLHARIAAKFEEFPSVVAIHRDLCHRFETAAGQPEAPAA